MNLSFQIARIFFMFTLEYKMAMTGLFYLQQNKKQTCEKGYYVNF